MKSVSVVLVTVLLLWTPVAPAQECAIFNGSFELDGAIVDIAVQDPNGWQAHVTAPQFRGTIDDEWVTDGLQNLRVWSDWFVVFAAGDTGVLSQTVDLTGVDEVLFDVKLDTWSGGSWDPAVASAVVFIDDEVVWESPAGMADARGEYLDQRFAVPGRYQDEQPHVLSLGVRVNVDEMLFERYITDWDNLDCSLLCGGGGVLAGDVNRDCFVDVNDWQLLADSWLALVEPDSELNLVGSDDVDPYAVGPKGVVNFNDYATIAGNWLVVCGPEESMAGDLNADCVIDAGDLELMGQWWLTLVQPYSRFNPFDGDDLTADEVEPDMIDPDRVDPDGIGPRGVVNFNDYVILAGDWLGSSLIAEPVAPEQP